MIPDNPAIDFNYRLCTDLLCLRYDPFHSYLEHRSWVFMGIGQMKRRFNSGSTLRFFLLSLIAIASQAAWAEKTDIVFLKNGDRITGEVKSLARGKLQLSTDNMGTLSIEWESVLQITSSTGQSVELTNGQRFYGALVKPEDDSKLLVSTTMGMADIDIEEVVSMYPVESNFWDRLDFTANVGLSWDKGSEVGKYNLSMDAEYRRTQSISKASFSTEITTQTAADNTQRTTLSGMHNIFLPNKRYYTYFANLERNDQLGIDVRALAGAGYGWVPVRSQKNWFSFALGLDVNREIPTSGETETNLEGVAWLTYEYYQFDSPQRTFTTNFVVFPSITDWGRWRANLDTQFKLELINDLYWAMDFYANYDTASISSGAASSDYGVTTSLGYNF